MKIDELARELEAVIRSETTTTANVATTAVPLGGVAPGAGGGSVKPWGDWDSKKAKERQFKNFNKQLAKNKLPVRESSGDGYDLDVDKNASQYDLLAALVSPTGEVLDNCWVGLSLDPTDFRVDGKRMAFISDIINSTGVRGLGRKLVAKTVNWLLKHGMILATGEGIVDAETGKLVRKHTRTAAADRMHDTLAAAGSGSKIVDGPSGLDDPSMLARYRVYPKPMAESEEVEVVKFNKKPTAEAAAVKHKHDARCEEQLKYDDARDAWVCPSCGWIGPNAPAAVPPQHLHLGVAEAAGLPAFLVSAEEAEKFFARKFEQAIAGNGSPVKGESSMPDSTLLTVLPGDDAGSPRGDDSEKYPPMMRRPMPRAKPVKDHPMQPYARFTTEAHEGSLWVAIMLPEETSKEILAKYARGEPKDEGAGPHITLAYYGDKSKHPPDAYERIKNAVAKVAAEHGPLEFKLTGSGKFAASPNSDGMVPVYVVPSAVGLAALRTDIVRAITEAGIEYGSPFDFVPHVCVGYVKEAEVEPPTIEPGLTWTTDKVTVMANPEKAEFALGGASGVKEDVDPNFDYLWTQWPGKDDQLGPELPYEAWLKARKHESEAATHFVKSVLDASK